MRLPNVVSMIRNNGWQPQPSDCGRFSPIADNHYLKKKHRLSIDRYSVFNIVAFTCCVQDKKPLINNHSVFHAFKDLLLEALETYCCDAHVFLFMPDHGHLVLQGRNENANIWKCMVAFKQKTGFWLSKNSPNVKWQKDFYDHILRKDEDLRRQIEYILANPVRKGLVEYWKAFPYKGSTVFAFNEWD
jgi:putative transposase